MKDSWNYIKLNLIEVYISIFVPDYSFKPSKYEKSYYPYVRHLYRAFSIKYFFIF